MLRIPEDLLARRRQLSSVADPRTLPEPERVAGSGRGRRFRKNPDPVFGPALSVSIGRSGALLGGRPEAGAAQRARLQVEGPLQGGLGS